MRSVFLTTDLLHDNANGVLKSAVYFEIQNVQSTDLTLILMLSILYTHICGHTLQIAIVCAVLISFSLLLHYSESALDIHNFHFPRNNLNTAIQICKICMNHME